jgi:FkbM family methyltransferase
MIAMRGSAGLAAKRLVARLPVAWQQALKRWRFGRQLRAGGFRSEEREFDLLETFVRPGDWVIDVGANVGHYTVRLAQLVGPSGRVLAFEPVIETLELLATNVRRLRLRNVTLLHAAASDGLDIAHMEVPKFGTGMDNYYRAQITGSGGDFGVMTLPIDCLVLPHRVSLVKIDSEGHELSVLRGMRRLLTSDLPNLIVEDSVPELTAFLQDMGYQDTHLAGPSPNRVFRPSVAGGGV